MPQANLTAISVEKLKPPHSGQVEYYDRRQPAFGLRVSYHGSKSWFLMTRIDGKLVRITLGKYPVLSLSDAREQARAAARLTAEGKDPRLVQAETRRLRREDAQNTFGACASDFLRKHAERHLRPSTQREYRRILTGHDTQTWRDVPISRLTKRDVLEVIESMDQRGSPGAAKRALVYLRKFFKWCAERDIIAAPPTDRISPPHPEVRRDRVLSREELIYLLPALQAEAGIFGPVVHMLLLTGQRRAEVAGLRWSELKNIDGENPVWEIPSYRTKNKQGHLVPLSGAVRDILLGMPRLGDLVFTTTGDTAISGFGKAKARIDQRITTLRTGDGLAPMSPWTLHDLRRTMVTVMNEHLHVLPHVVEAVVNHMSGLAKAGVAGVYNRATYLDERRRALDAWATFVDQISPSISREASNLRRAQRQSVTAMGTEAQVITLNAAIHDIDCVIKTYRNSDANRT